MHHLSGESLTPCGPTANNGQRVSLAAPALVGVSGRSTRQVCASEYREAVAEAVTKGCQDGLAVVFAVVVVIFGLLVNL